MTNREIAKAFQELSQLMELHQENGFKIRSYSNAYRTLRKLDEPLSEKTPAELGSIKGVGKAIAGKIGELVETGSMETLERYRALTPPGVREMLQIGGFGPKKVHVVWQELGVESVGELLYAVNENRLIELKGFGQKTQEDLRQKLEYYQRNRDKFYYATLDLEARDVERQLRQAAPGTKVSRTGGLRRKDPTPSYLDFLIGTTPLPDFAWLENSQDEPYGKSGLSPNGYPVRLFGCAAGDFGSKLFRYTGADDFLQAFMEAYPDTDFRHKPTEVAVFEQVGLPVIAPELREGAWALQLAQQDRLPTLIEATDIRGVVHAHTTASDGIHTLRQMVEYARALGYTYLTVTDHSKSAFYADGLSPERLWKQMEEIDALNQELTDFRVFKGSECDILNDGSLDYDDDLLAALDIVIASVHSNLRMDEDKATQRLLTAIEHPRTHMLGHPTGRLLLSRRGYPIDHRKVIDACAANGVCIELNANPYRLDLDWTWLPYALEKEVPISINPDAHSQEGILHIQYGIAAARKGGLTAAQCLNAKVADDFAAWLALK